MTSSSRLLRPSSEDNLVGSLLSKSTTLPSHSPHTKPKVNGSPTHNQFESRPTYAVPSRKPPRPTQNAKKRAIRSRTVDCIPIPIQGSATVVQLVSIANTCNTVVPRLSGL